MPIQIMPLDNDELRIKLQEDRISKGLRRLSWTLVDLRFFFNGGVDERYY